MKLDPPEARECPECFRPQTSEGNEPPGSPPAHDFDRSMHGMTNDFQLACWLVVYFFYPEKEVGDVDSSLLERRRHTGKTPGAGSVAVDRLAKCWAIGLHQSFLPSLEESKH